MRGPCRSVEQSISAHDRVYSDDITVCRVLLYKVNGWGNKFEKAIAVKKTLENEGVKFNERGCIADRNILTSLQTITGTWMVPGVG